MLTRVVDLGPPATLGALNEGAVGKAACVGIEACVRNTGTVAKLGCRGDLACRVSSANVGVDACHGESACAGSRAVSIGKASCIGTSACFMTGPNPIGKNACRGDRACFNNAGPIGDGECVGPPVGGVGVCERLQTSIDSNVVTLTASNESSSNTLVNIEYIEGSLVVTSGQPFAPSPTISQSGSEWTITVMAGRQGSTPVAKGFYGVTGGASHLLPTESYGDTSPSELNFYLGVNLTVEVNATTFRVPVYLGQGHSYVHNNWWFGGAAVTSANVVTEPPPLLIITGAGALAVGSGSLTLTATNINSFVLDFCTAQCVVSRPTVGAVLEEGTAGSRGDR